MYGDLRGKFSSFSKHIVLSVGAVSGRKPTIVDSLRNALISAVVGTKSSRLGLESDPSLDLVELEFQTVGLGFGQSDYMCRRS